MFPWPYSLRLGFSWSAVFYTCSPVTGEPQLHYTGLAPNPDYTGSRKPSVPGRVHSIPKSCRALWPVRHSDSGLPSRPSSVLEHFTLLSGSRLHRPHALLPFCSSPRLAIAQPTLWSVLFEVRAFRGCTFSLFNMYRSMKLVRKMQLADCRTYTERWVCSLCRTNARRHSSRFADFVDQPLRFGFGGRV